jgi:glycerol-1-phosphatase
MQGCNRILAKHYDVALLDLDGVVYVGEQAVPDAPAALAECRQQGMRLAFVTNNASRTPTQVVDLLGRVGVPAAVQEVTTAAMAAAHYLADALPAGAKVLVLGTTGLIEALTERGLTPVFSADEAPAAVVQGYSPTLDWAALAEGAVAIRAGALYLATNLDPTVPSPRGPLPGNGSLVAALVHATGVTPKATGKPDPIVVGDRLDTDIAGSRRVGCASLLVLSGVTDGRALLQAGPDERPDYLGHDVSALLVRHPDVATTGDRTTCGNATVSHDGEQLTLTGAGGLDGLDGLRALAAAAWQVADAGGRTTKIVGIDPAAIALLADLGLN